MNNLSLQTLIATMNKNDLEFLTKMNLGNDAVVINQINSKEITHKQINNNLVTYVKSNEKGLSKSRNMAIKYSNSDICQLCDDDEILYRNSKNIIIQAYTVLKDADIIVFKVENNQKKIKNKIHLLNKFELFKVNSVMITFKRSSIISNKLQFDINIGAGTKNGGGEEIKFLLDAYKKGLKIYYYPSIIAKLDSSTSTWFTGYDKQYFFQRGVNTKYIMGKYLGAIYNIYFVISKYNLYKDKISLFNALYTIFDGYKNGSIQEEV